MISSPTPQLAVLFGAILSLAIWTTPRVRGQTLQGDLTPYEHSAYAGVASHFLLENATSDGALVFVGSAVMLCADFEGISLAEDPDPYSSPVQLGYATPDQMDVWGRFSTPQNEALAIAQVSWLIDHRFGDHFLNPTGDIHAKQFAFQNVLWEIIYDGGTEAGLDWATGNFKSTKFSDTVRYGTELWSAMNELRAAVENSGVTEFYVPEIPVYATLDSRPGYQDYLIAAEFAPLVSPGPLAPEPGVLSLVVVGGLFLGRRRRDDC